VLSDDARFVLVANTGSDDVSVLSADGPTLVSRVPSGGAAPKSIAVNGSTIYVLNTDAHPSVSGFRLGRDGSLTAIEGSTRPLSSDDADPAQVAFSPDGRTLIVTERGTNTISTYAVREDGTLDGPAVVPSAGATPYGFDFARDGALVVTEAFGGEVGAAAASSYRFDGATSLRAVSSSVRNTRSEVCWAAATRDGRFVFVTNFGDGTISSYEIGDDGSLSLLDPVAATTVEGAKGVRDEAVSRDGSFLYALDADARRVFGYAVGADGTLSPVGSIDGVPATVAGLAAS
jgi:DNA-binding beta-propeller fold protein YncE